MLRLLQADDFKSSLFNRRWLRYYNISPWADIPSRIDDALDCTPFIRHSTILVGKRQSSAACLSRHRGFCLGRACGPFFPHPTTLRRPLEDDGAQTHGPNAPLAWTYLRQMAGRPTRKGIVTRRRKRGPRRLQALPAMLAGTLRKRWWPMRTLPLSGGGW